MLLDFDHGTKIENFKVKLSKTTIIDGSDSIATEGTMEVAEEEINKNVSEEKCEGKVLNTTLPNGIISLHKFTIKASYKQFL